MQPQLRLKLTQYIKVLLHIGCKHHINRQLPKLLTRLRLHIIHKVALRQLEQRKRASQVVVLQRRLIVISNSQNVACTYQKVVVQPAMLEIVDHGTHIRRHLIQLVTHRHCQPPLRHQNKHRLQHVSRMCAVMVWVVRVPILHPPQKAREFELVHRKVAQQARLLQHKKSQRGQWTLVRHLSEVKRVKHPLVRTPENLFNLGNQFSRHEARLPFEPLPRSAVRHAGVGPQHTHLVILTVLLRLRVLLSGLLLGSSSRAGGGVVTQKLE